MFQLKPILQEMKELYSFPVSGERFKEYISKLQGGTKGDLSVPIAGFNPMAKAHILTKIEELESLNAESIIQEEIQKFNLQIEQVNDLKIEIVLNIADDLKGSWTNPHTTDYDSKFKLNAFVKRNFCVPYFWTSETYSKDLIVSRTQEYANRTLYWTKNAKPLTLADHLKQEVFVFENSMKNIPSFNKLDFEFISSFYSKYKNSEDYNLIFNFFYGDKASSNLGYKKYGIQNLTGFDYAKFLAIKG